MVCSRRVVGLDLATLCPIEALTKLYELQRKLSS
jgi:hypothetical protein